MALWVRLNNGRPAAQAMIPKSQRAVFTFLAKPETHGPGVDRVDQVHTHISALFLAGERVLKLKRAVALPYLDHTTLAARKACCEREVAINAPGAPGLYRGVMPVTRESDGTLALDGAGEPVEWLVVMNRFDQGALFDRRLALGHLDRHQMSDLAEVIFAAHERAERIDDDRGLGFGRNLEGALAELAQQRGLLGEALSDEVAAALRAAHQRLKPLLAERAAAGRVRRCHGDLHLRNIVLWDDHPVLFDAIDFTETFVRIDVLYDLAYLLMDLDHRGHRRLASITFNHYMEFAGDTGGLAALPLFLALRATIRAFVTAAGAANQSDGDEAARLIAEGRGYLAQATGYLTPGSPRLVAVGGLSGSGKSRLAREIAPYLGCAPGALVLRTDVLRKRLMGLSPYQSLGPEGYTPEMHARTYQMLEAEARLALACGHSVVLDGVHARPGERANAERIAAEAGVPFAGLWVHTPVDLAMRRIETRVRNPSDVTLAVRANQEDFDLGAVTWARVDSSGPKKDTVAAGLTALGLSS